MMVIAERVDTRVRSCDHSRAATPYNLMMRPCRVGSFLAFSHVLYSPWR